MAQSDILKRYLDAGLAFTAMTRSQAEAIVKDLLEQGEVQTEQAQTAVRDLVDRSRQNTERLLDQVRSEVQDQIRSLGLATQTDIERLERRIGDLGRSTPARKTAAKRSPAKKSPAKKSTAKRSTAKRSTAKKSTGGTKKA